MHDLTSNPSVDVGVGGACMDFCTLCVTDSVTQMTQRPNYCRWVRGSCKLSLPTRGCRQFLLEQKGRASTAWAEKEGLFLILKRISLHSDSAALRAVHSKVWNYEQSMGMSIFKKSSAVVDVEPTPQASQQKLIWKILWKPFSNLNTQLAYMHI